MDTRDTHTGREREREREQIRVARGARACGACWKGAEGRCWFRKGTACVQSSSGATASPWVHAWRVGHRGQRGGVGGGEGREAEGQTRRTKSGKKTERKIPCQYCPTRTFVPHQIPRTRLKTACGRLCSPVAKMYVDARAGRG